MKAFLAIAAIVLAATLAFWFGQKTSDGRPDVDVPAGAIENDPTDEEAVGHDPNLAAMLAGEWKSLGNAGYTRVFSADGKFYDTYRGGPAGAPGVWALAAEGPNELWLDSEGDRTRFRVVAVTPGLLQLVYLDGNGVQRYERVR